MALHVLAAVTPRVSETGPLTTTALILIALFAALAIIGIIYGARQKRIRAAAEEEEERRATELAQHDNSDESGAPATLAEPERTAAAPTPPRREALSPELTPTPAPKPIPTPAPAPEHAPKPAAATKVTVTPEPAKPTPPAPAQASSSAEPTGSPAPKDEPSASPAAAGYPLTEVKGLGPKAAALLESMGIADVTALAALDDARAVEVDARLGAFSGRMMRDRWVEQARLLDAGDIAAFEATFGKL